MKLFNKYDVWPIARFNNYQFGLLSTAILTMSAILGFLYLIGDNLNIRPKIIVAISQNHTEQNINSIIQLFDKYEVKHDYKIIPETEISKLLIGFENRDSISKYLSNNENYTLPIFIEFNYKSYSQLNIENILQEIVFHKYILNNSLGLMNMFIYSIYFIFLLLGLSFCNIFSLKLDKKAIIIMKNYGADKNLLMSILFRRITHNTLLGFFIGWLFIFILLHILYITASTSSNTIQFINLKNINSFFYFMSLLIMVLASQYIIISKIVSKYMRITIE